MAFFRPELPEKLNICLVTKKFPNPARSTEDSDSYIWPIAKNIVSRGHSLTVLAWQNPKGKAEYISPHLRVFFLGERINNSSRKHFPTQAFRKFVELHEQNPFHIVHSLDESGIQIGEKRKIFGVVMTYDVSATQMSQIFSILGMAQDTLGGLLSTGFAVCYKFLTTFYGADRSILKSADGVFVASPLQQIILERYYMYPELKTYIVPYGMDFVKLDYTEKDPDLYKRLGLPTDTRYIVTITDMTELSETLNILKSFAKVVVKKPNTRLIIIGHGPLKKEIEYEALGLVLGNKTIFTGTLSAEEISQYLEVADIYINLSSRTTGFEPAMLEAMAQKKVVIGSELSPISTVIEDQNNGFLIRPADVTSLTQLLQNILMGNISAQTIGDKAREKVLNLFNVDIMVDKILNAYFEILRRTGRKARTIRRIKPQDSEIST
jgi:1,2-diacylglycerol 3-alpha-glucosyltransferase